MAKKTFDMMVWYTQDEFGKAWTTIEADTGKLKAVQL